MSFQKYCGKFLTIVIILTFLTPKRSFVIAQDLPVGARSLGMGGAYVALANTSDALFLNPGGLSQIDGTHITIFYQKPFGLEDVNFGSAAASISIWKTRLNFGVTTFGNNLFNEQTFSLAFSHHYQRRIFYGVAVRYKSISIENHGSSGTFGLDLGFVVPISRQLSWGFLTKNINRPNIGSDEELPQSFKSGLSVSPVADLIVNFEIFKDVRFPEEIRFGVEFQPIQKLALRTGTATNPSRFSAGFGVSVNQFTIDYAFFTHNDLGLTHQFSFSIHLKEKLEKVKTPVMPPVAAKQMDTSKEKINVNIATIEDLVKIKGIGKFLAKAIVDYRAEHGPFSKIEELLKISGIGSKKLEMIKENIFVDQIADK